MAEPSSLLAPSRSAVSYTTCATPYASQALALRERLPMSGRLLGQTQVKTTARYAHLA